MRSPSAISTACTAATRRCWLSSLRRQTRPGCSLRRADVRAASARVLRAATRRPPRGQPARQARGARSARRSNACLSPTSTVGSRSMSAEEFIDDVLVRGCRRAGCWSATISASAPGAAATSPCCVHARSAAVTKLRNWPSVTVDGERVSSSAVRAAPWPPAISNARQRLLGRPYSISGRVVHGAKLGRDARLSDAQPAHRAQAPGR